MSHPPADPARNRFFMMQVMRLAGLGAMMLGLAVWHGDLVRPGGDILLGLPLTLLGIAVTAIGPQWLARRWRTPRI